MSLLSHALKRRSSAQLIQLQRKARIGELRSNNLTSFAPVFACCQVPSGTSNSTCIRWNSSSGNSPQQTTRQPLDRKQSRLPRTLYRQLLQWCRDTNSDVPLGAFVEPFILAPPQIDPQQFQGLAELYQLHKDSSTENDTTTSTGPFNKIIKLLPPRIRMNTAQSQLQVHVNSVADLRQLIRAMFRLNDMTDKDREESVRKERVSFAFQSLRSLNELNKSIMELNRQRQLHMDRGGEQDDNTPETTDDNDKKPRVVEYHVGQVVQHKGERWRGVILGWEKPEDSIYNQKSPKKLTSLTTKVYTAADFLNSIRYEVLIDQGDSDMLRATSSFIVCSQEDLELVTDPNLFRIRSGMVADHFKRFDDRSKSFVMSDMLAYEYPIDHDRQQQAFKENLPNNETDNNEPSLSSSDTVNDTAEHVSSKVRAFAKHLEELATLPKDQEEQLSISVSETLQVFRTKISWALDTNLATHAWPGMSEAQRQDAVLQCLGEDDKSPVTVAAARIRQLLNFCLEVRDLLWHRQTSQMFKSELKFGLGDVVYHKGFGFRGVVKAFDYRPTIDVSRWDGVQHIENPLERPFYHVMPDLQDCVEVFGAPRGMRYVCSDNLEPCHSDRTSIEVQLEPGWTRTLSPDGTTLFLPPARTKFKHGADLADDDVTEETLIKVQEAITLWMVASREGTDKVCADETTFSETCIPLEDLLMLLKAADRMDDAIVFQEAIKEIWKAHTIKELRLELDQGIADVIRGKAATAVETFKSIKEKDNNYAEAWNKVAACEYMLGNRAPSLAAAKKVVEMIPTHFQAHNGVGLCAYDSGVYEEAAAAFRRSLELDPWSPVSSKLAACVDMLNRQKETSGKETEKP